MEENSIESTLVDNKIVLSTSSSAVEDFIDIQERKNINPSQGENFLTNLLKIGNTESVLESKNLNFTILNEKVKDPYSITLSEGVIFKGWKNVENISSRVLDYYEETIVLECLIDKEISYYEEWELPISSFKEFKLELGKVFKLCYYQRGSQTMMEVLEDPRLVMEDDFPKVDFVAKFRNSNILKKKK
jgi:hypothetical protein